VYLLLGEERYLRNSVTAELRKAAMAGGIAGLNDDQFNASSATPQQVVAAARTLPMLAKWRWVLVSDVERWEGKAETESKAQDLAVLADYLTQPSPSTLLVLSAEKLTGKNRLLTAAKKLNGVVECAALPRNELLTWLSAQANSRKTPVSRSAAELLLEVIGTELSALEEAIERLSLFAGAGKNIDETTVEQLIPIVPTATVWELLDAIARRKVRSALETLARVYDPSDRGLRLIGLLLWSARQLLRFQGARQRGMGREEAAKAAGIPPFKARDVEATARELSPAELESWLIALRDADLALKGGSRRPPQNVLESLVLQLCGAPALGSPQATSQPSPSGKASAAPFTGQ
jgi:DNA polymerase-3 subunit delta